MACSDFFFQYSFNISNCLDKSDSLALFNTIYNSNTYAKFREILNCNKAFMYKFMKPSVFSKIRT